MPVRSCEETYGSRFLRIRYGHGPHHRLGIRIDDVEDIRVCTHTKEVELDRVRDPENDVVELK